MSEYDAAWSQEARHLVSLAKAGREAPTHGREAEAEAVLRHLDAGRSVLLVGPDGVGKSAVVRAVAARMAARGKGAIGELSTAQFLAGTRYLGEWQTKVAAVVRAADGQTIYVPDAPNLPFAGRTAQSPTNLLDALRPALQQGRVRLLGEASPEALRNMQRTPSFVELFAQVAVEPLAAEQADAVVVAEAARLGLPLDTPTRRLLFSLSSRFMAFRPQPGPALTVLGQVLAYKHQKDCIGEAVSVDADFVERVFSIYSGLPRFVVGASETRNAAELRAWFSERIVGQTEAIEAVVQAIALFKAGLQDPKRPLGTFLFVGPTGVGKTELARALATLLFSGPHRLLRFDLGEYQQPDSVERLLGSPHRPEEPAVLVDPVRAQPFQVVLLDEIEKAHPRVWDALLAMLDEGRLTTPRGETVDFRNTFVIATSNVGAEESERALGFGAAPDPAQRRGRVWEALQRAFRPELLNRFQHVVVFHALDDRQVRRIARHELRDILQRDGVTSRNLVVDVDEEALDLVVSQGFDPRWGARGLKRELQRQIVTPLAMTLLERRVEPGTVIKVTGRDGVVRVRLLDTPAAPTLVAAEEPIRLAGRASTRADLASGLRQLREQSHQLSLGVDEAFLAEEQARILELRRDPAFWRDAESAARDLRDLDAATSTLDTLERLRSRLVAYEEDLARSHTREQLLGIARRHEQLESALGEAWRELVVMGRDGSWDALVEVQPLQGGRAARDLLARTYLAWAAWREAEVVWLLDPRADEEPAFFAIKGRYAFGLLRWEAGIHKLREGEDHAAARVRVGAWTDHTRPVVFREHHALKAVGALGGRLRSRLVCDSGLVLQNERTLADNRELAVEVAAAWAEAAPAPDAIVRRYDLTEPLLRDTLTGFTSGRPDALAPERFDALLALRVDHGSQGPRAA